MQDIMGTAAELDADAARTVAAAMREVARVDGSHPREEALIDAFEADLPGDAGAVDLSTLKSAADKEAFLKSCVLVAFADGSLSDAELELLKRYTAGMGLDPADLTRATRDVASALLSQFAGVKVYRDQVVQIGRQLGLDDKTIQSTLG